MEQTPGVIAVVPLGSGWISTPCGLVVVGNITIPEGAIAYVHTHPFGYGEDLSSICDDAIEPNYKNPPSIPDKDALFKFAARIKNPNLLGIIIDKEKIIDYNSTGSEINKYERCGY